MLLLISPLRKIIKLLTKIKLTQKGSRLILVIKTTPTSFASEESKIIKLFTSETFTYYQ